jgi:hypothetical protein
MKRLLIYTLLGPPIGLAVVLAITAPFEPLVRDNLDRALLGAVALAIPFSYPAGLLPAIIVAVVDQLLAKRGLALWPRICACAGAGYVVTMLGAYGFRLPPNGRYLLVGLVGAVPAAVCAWLSGRSAAKTDVPDAAHGPR